MLLVCFAAGGALLGRIGADVRTFQALYCVGFLGYVALAWVTTRCDSAATLGAWRWWLIGSIAVRVLLLPTAPSDDTHRYVWEGRIQLAGFNPFRHPPNDPRLIHLRGDDWTKINHPDYPAIYGPVAQLEFLAAAAVHPHPFALKVAHVLWDVLIVIVLAWGLRRSGRPPHGAIVYALCPLVLTAFGVEGHLDSLMLLFVALAVWAMSARRTSLAAAMVGLAIATKVVAVVLLPWFVIRRRTAGLPLTFRESRSDFRRASPVRNVKGERTESTSRPLRGAGRVKGNAMIIFALPVAIPAVVVGLCYLPYSTAGLGVFSSLVRFGSAEEFFSLLGAFGVTSFESTGAHWVVASVLGLVLIALARRARDFSTYGAAAMGALLMLTPVVHYWYVSWVLALLPFGVRLRWMVAALAMAVYFEAESARGTTGVWSMPSWAPLAVWLAFAAAWGVELLALDISRIAKGPPTGFARAVRNVKGGSHDGGSGS